MPSRTFETFRQAMERRRQIVCVYHGRNREVCPHALGWKDGRERALTFQFAADSESGLPPGGEWRCMTLAEVTDARWREGKWHTGERKSPMQSCVEEIATEIV